jgi:selenocysteine lyase/cysteine desulfurase
VVGLQTTRFREEAREIVRNACNASEHDAVLFLGAGVTGAVHRLVHALDIRRTVAKHGPGAVVVVCGPMEHHSAFLPWSDAGATVLRVRRCASDGRACQRHLASVLQASVVKGAELVVGVFSAASNVTGFVEDVDAISAALHGAGALAIWDYATGGPYLPIDMNPAAPAGAHKDAVLLSPHKFVGGVGAPGILIAKKALFRNATPAAGGGGSVFFVSQEGHRYLKDIESREEGGTPNIVGSIRAGLAFRLKMDATTAAIMAREETLVARAEARLGALPGLHLLGRQRCNADGMMGATADGQGGGSAGRLPIFSFAVFHPPSGRYLHYNAVVTLLNDLFGIQARGGCACAGPYAQELLGMTPDQIATYEALLLEDERLDRVHLRRRGEHGDREVLRPGFVRFNLPWFMADAEVDFVLDAVAFVAEHGWKLLPLYKLNMVGYRVKICSFWMKQARLFNVASI